MVFEKHQWVVKIAMQIIQSEAIDADALIVFKRLADFQVKVVLIKIGLCEFLFVENPAQNHSFINAVAYVRRYVGNMGVARVKEISFGCRMFYNNSPVGKLAVYRNDLSLSDGIHFFAEIHAYIQSCMLMPRFSVRSESVQRAL